MSGTLSTCLANVQRIRFIHLLAHFKYVNVHIFAWVKFFDFYRKLVIVRLFSSNGHNCLPS